MKTTHTFTRSGIACYFTLFLILTFPLIMKGQTISMISDSLQTHVYSFADDNSAPCNPPPFFDEDEFDIPSHNMVAGLLGYSFATEFGVESTDLCEARANANASAFYGVSGNASNAVSVVWTQFGQSYHTAPFCPDGYVARSFSNSHATMNFEVSGVPAGTPVTVFYSYTAYSAAYPDPENLVEDTAQVLPLLTLDNIDLFTSAGINMNFGNPPLTVGGLRHNNLGSIDVLAGQPFAITIDGSLLTTVTAPPKTGAAIGSSCTQKDRATAAFSGELQMRLSAPFTFPPQNPVGLDKLFSVDIGSATEFSDPAPNGAEVFDPGDAYLFHAPILPPGGTDGLVDDASFMAGDIFPDPPEIGPPYLTAAPTGSGIPLGLIQSDFFDMDGLDMLDFIVVPDPTGPQATNPGPCLFNYDNLFISYDDDGSSNYASVMPSIPVNSSSALNNYVFGEVSNKDEVMEIRSLLFNPQQSISFPWYNEEDVHPNLGPNPIFNPDPMIFNEEDDDVDALDFHESGGCPQIYVSVDHEAAGIDASGITPDPGIIYRVGAPGSGLIPTVLHPDLGIAPGTDINAFEFVSLPDPASPLTVFDLLLVYSVDVDDPLTADDESGGLLPDVLYGSFLDGISFPMDTSPANFDNIDALTSWAHSLTPLTFGSTCRQSNFPTAPTNFSTTFFANYLRLKWDAVPFSTTCQILGNKVIWPGDANILVTNNGLPPKKRDFFLGNLAPNTEYRAKIRCGCFDNNNVPRATPFTPYIFFTTPGPIVENDDDGYGSLDFTTMPNLKIAPNPASESVQFSLTNINEDQVFLRVYDNIGKLVLEKHLTIMDGMKTLELEVSNWDTGIYLINIVSTNTVITEKLSIE